MPNPFASARTLANNAIAAKKPVQIKQGQTSSRTGSGRVPGASVGRAVTGFFSDKSGATIPRNQATAGVAKRKTLPPASNNRRGVSSGGGGNAWGRMSNLGPAQRGAQRGARPYVGASTLPAGSWGEGVAGAGGAVRNRPSTPGRGGFQSQAMEVPGRKPAGSRPAGFVAAPNMAYSGGLSVDSIAGPKTLASLGNVGAPVNVDRNLKIGSRGGDVTSLQDKLRSKGFDPGTSDGIFGAKTQAAVAAYQRSTGGL